MPGQGQGLGTKGASVSFDLLLSYLRLFFLPASAAWLCFSLVGLPEK